MAVIYLSGAETPNAVRDLIANGATHIMFSYYEIQRGRTIDKVLQILEAHPAVRVFLTAGSGSVVRHDLPVTPYFRSYCRFIREHGFRFQYATELDLDGYDPNRFDNLDMEEWRDELALLGTVPIVPVWRPHRGIPAWKALCGDPRYPRLATGRLEPAVWSSLGPQFLALAHKSGKTVHGFGTKHILKTLQVARYNSVDSANWKAGERWGHVFMLIGTDWKMLGDHTSGGREARKKYRTYFQSIGCDPKKIFADDPAELRKANIIAWLNLSKRLQAISGEKVDHADTIEPTVYVPPPRKVMKLYAKKKAEAADTSMRLLPADESGVRHLPEGGSEPPAEGSQTGKIIPMHLVKPERPRDKVSVAMTVREGAQPAERLTKGMMTGTFLQCSTCAIGPVCPKYREGSACAFSEEFREMPTRDINDVATSLAMLVEENASRFRHGRLMEQALYGGSPQKDVTDLSQALALQLGTMAKVMRTTKSARVTGSGEGILSKIFGGLVEPKRITVGGEDDQEAPSSLPILDVHRDPAVPESPSAASDPPEPPAASPESTDRR